MDDRVRPRDFSSLGDFITWQLPRDQTGVLFQQLLCSFAEAPDRESLVSFSVSDNSWPGKAGQVLVGIVGITGHILIPFAGGFRAHTIDIVFDSIPDRPTEVFLGPRPGIQLLLFRSITLKALPPVLSPA